MGLSRFMELPSARGRNDSLPIQRPITNLVMLSTLGLTACHSSLNQKLKTEQKPAHFSKIVSIQLETIEMRINRIWGPHKKISEAVLSLEGISIGMEFTDFESLLSSDGFSKEWFMSANHYSGENDNCQAMSPTSDYLYNKIQVIDGKSTLLLIDATKCLSDKDQDVWLLESQPTLLKFEKNNAKN